MKILPSGQLRLSVVIMGCCLYNSYSLLFIAFVIYTAKIVPAERHELAQKPEVQPILCKSTKKYNVTDNYGAKSIGHPLKRGKGPVGHLLH